MRSAEHVERFLAEMVHAHATLASPAPPGGGFAAVIEALCEPHEKPPNAKTRRNDSTANKNNGGLKKGWSDTWNTPVDEREVGKRPRDRCHLHPEARHTNEVCSVQI